MSYRCVLKESKECDGCMECKEQPKLRCDQCDTPIYEGDLYYYIDGEVYCEDCTKDIFGVYA